MTIKMPQTASLIDTLSQGYSAINRRPWLLLLPILLNLYIWFGPQLSFGPLFVDLASDLSSSMPADLQMKDADGVTIDPAELIRAIGSLDMRQPIAVLNYIPFTFYVLGSMGTSGGTLGMPMVQSAPQPLDPSRTTVISVSNVFGVLLAVVLLNVVALPLSAIFLTQIAEAVRGDRAPIAVKIQRSAMATLSILACVGVVVGISILLGLPFIVLSAILMSFSAPLGLMLFGMLLILFFWVRIYLGFANEAIVVSGIGPLRALHASFNIVRRNFWSTIGFLIVSAVIALGGSVIWQMIATTTIGLLAAIVCSAYLGSGLLAARMAFYRERLRLWQNAVAPARSR